MKGNMDPSALGFKFNKHLISSTQIMVGDVLSVAKSSGKIHSVCVAEGVLWSCHRDGFKTATFGGFSDWADEHILVDRVKGFYKLQERLANIYILFCIYNRRMYINGSKETHLHKRVLRYDYANILDLISDKDRAPSNEFAIKVEVLNGWLSGHSRIITEGILTPSNVEKYRMELFLQIYNSLRVPKGPKKVGFLTSKKAVKKSLLSILREI